MKKMVWGFLSAGFIAVAAIAAVFYFPTDDSNSTAKLSLTAQDQIEVLVGDRVSVEYEVNDTNCVISSKSSDKEIFTAGADSNGIIYVFGVADGSATLSITAKTTSETVTKDILVVVSSENSGSESSPSSDSENNPSSSSTDSDSDDDNTDSNEVLTLVADATEADLSGYLTYLTVTDGQIYITKSSNFLYVQDSEVKACEIYTKTDGGTYTKLSAVSAKMYSLPTDSTQYTLLIILTMQSGDSCYQLLPVTVL